MAEAVATAPFQTLRQIRGLKDIPFIRQLGMLLAVAAAVAAGLTLYGWSQKPDYQPLYAGLNAQDSAELAETLRAAGIDYRLDAANGAVTVPADRVHQARLDAAAKGLPRAGGAGFEMIQQEQGFGTSQFIENARWQLALETELARTVSSLQPVKSARVHLALPKPSAFTRNEGGPSASVVVELHAGRQLEANQVDSIQHIVGSSVPNLTPTSVTVIDQFGRLLSATAPDSDLAQSTEHYQYARRAEADYVRRIETLLAPMLGMDHVSAQVSADFDFSVTEEARERYEPEHSAVRSEQTSEDTRRQAEAAGIPGATSNQPPNTSTAAADAAAKNAGASTAGEAPPLSSSRSQSRNYELDRTISHTRQSIGRLQRLSVAVLVDNFNRNGADGKPVSSALTPEQLAKVEALVKQAVGFDAQRGDSVTVQNAAFISQTIAAPEPLPLWQRPDVRNWARQGIGALVILVLILAVLRPLLRTLIGGPAPRRRADEALAAHANGSELEGPDGEHLEGSVAPDRLALSGHAGAHAAPAQQATAIAPPMHEQKLALARSAVTQDPKRVAQVVKTWLNEEG